MQYRIGIVAELFGLTRETLRNYERAGLIVSNRDETNSYRYYDLETIHKIIGIRSLRNQGFSIDELKRVYTDISKTDYEMLLKEKTKQKEKEIELSIAILRQLKIMENQVAISPDWNTIQVVESPAYYLLHYSENDILQDRYLFSRWDKWTNNLFLVHNYRSYSKNLLQAHEAFAITEDLVDILGIDTSTPVRYQPPMRCICAHIERIERQRINANSLLAYMKTNNLEQIHPAFSITTFAHHAQGEKHSYMMLFIPFVSARDS